MIRSRSPLTRSLRGCLLVLVALLASPASVVRGQGDEGGDLGTAIEKLADRLAPSVVGVRVVEWVEGDASSGATAAPRSPNRHVILSVSGIVITKAGDVATIFKDGLPAPRQGGEVKLEVTLSSGDVCRAEWKATDEASGVSLLRIIDPPKSKLRAVKLARELPSAGAMVLSVGCSFGLNHSFHLGMVSGPNRRLRHAAFPQLIQTNLTANPGDVGGLLANTRGECLGMLALTLGDEQGLVPGKRSGGVLVNQAVGAGPQNVVFAIPAEVLERICVALRREGQVQRGALGASFYFRNRVEGECECPTHRCYGVQVMAVDPSGNAAIAGLRDGDIIARVDVREMATESDMYWFAQQVQYGTPGSKLRLEVHRHATESQPPIRIVQAIIGTYREPAAPKAPARDPDPAEDEPHEGQQ